ncbi:MAG: hypothetical protein ACRDLL_01870 [Solirubrobacterales bacterium]
MGRSQTIRVVAWTGLVALVAIALAGTAPSAGATSGYCGTITFKASHLRVKVFAHNVSCHEARHVGHIWGRGGRPKHWICSAADRTCYRHDVTSSHYAHFNRVRHHRTRPGPKPGLGDPTPLPNLTPDATLERSLVGSP